MNAALMIQGASSSVGKSLIVAGLCRLFARRGVKVAPFKSQNMSNNAAVCGTGGEIGRAQAMQAAAAGIEPTVDMNPILLKPEADHRSQVIVQGRRTATFTARDYFDRKQQLWPTVVESLQRLRAEYELIVIEGAGSPAELNLSAADIVNMAIARHLHCPVLLVGDIDRGGVFAQLLGTLDLLENDERKLVRGLIVNKFRGDRSLFADGIAILESRSGLPVLGVVPYLHNLDLPEEDAATMASGRLRNSSEVWRLPLQESDPCSGSQTSDGVADIAVIRLPHISNFDDFDPLAAEPGVDVRFIDAPETLGHPAAVILPGTKSTSADLAWLRRSGLADAVVRLARIGVPIVGICGGYQMLGRVIRDPLRVENDEAAVRGLGLLPAATTFSEHKSTFLAEASVISGPGWFRTVLGSSISGYEIHSGQTDSPCPWLSIGSRNGARTAVLDGAASDDGRVWGCYLHGLFANDGFRRAWLASLGHSAASGSFAQRQQAAFDGLADGLQASLNMPLLERIIAEGTS